MRYRLRTLLIVLSAAPVLLAVFWLGFVQPLVSAALGFLEAQKRSDDQERQMVSPPPAPNSD